MPAKHDVRWRLEDKGLGTCTDKERGWTSRGLRIRTVVKKHVSRVEPIGSGTCATSSEVKTNVRKKRDYHNDHDPLPVAILQLSVPPATPQNFCHDDFVLDGVERASGVHHLPADLYKREKKMQMIIS